MSGGAGDARLTAQAAGEAVETGRTALGIELGSTNIKACLIDADTHQVIASGSHAWENQYVDGLWTYSLDAVWAGLTDAYARLVARVTERTGARLVRPGAIGVSAMMHGYLAFDSRGELLVPFRTWRNTNTGRASAELSEAFGRNIPLRWSVAHLYQAVLDDEPHLANIDFVTTLAGYVHWRLTGERVLGIGDAAGMFPIDDATRDYDERHLEAFAARAPGIPGLREILPEVRLAGASAGVLTEAGARLLDPTGALEAGVPLAPAEGDAGTGMVATGAVAPRTGNVSVGTSVFAMVVLERALTEIHDEIDLVTTPAGDAVAMVHCNNGGSELAEWVGLFTQFARAAGAPVSTDDAFAALFAAAARGPADAGGFVAYNHLSGEPVAGIDEGRPLVVRTPDSVFSLEAFMRAQLYGVFGTLVLGMQVLAGERVALDRMYAHGGIFKTEGVAQQILADALNAPMSVGETASEGGAWGMAVLASYLLSRGQADPAPSLDAFLGEHVFASAPMSTLPPDAAGAAGFSEYLTRYRAGLAAERAAATALPPLSGSPQESLELHEPEPGTPRKERA